MKSIKQLLGAKGQEIWSIGPEATVLEAITMMAEREIGALLVLEGKKLAGILSERDYARKIILQGKSSGDTLVGDIMTKRVACARPNQSVEECLALMTDKRVRHLPVMDGEELIGILSIGDLVKEVIAEQKFVIDQLEHYISG